MVEEQEAQTEHDEAQTIEGYGCTCGFRTDDAKEIRTHVMLSSAQDGKGTHKSLGRINLQTGETVLPPWNKRTKEQKRGSTHGKHAREAGTEGAGAPLRTTDVLANAQELRFVPRVYTTDYSPIIRAAQDAASEFWGWPRDMTLGDFLDTALHFLFAEHGITLAGYTVSDEAREALEAERKAQEAQEAGEPKELQEVAK